MLRRTPLRRSRPKPRFRPEDDKVTPELHDYILDRDKRCFAAKIEPGHECRDRFGHPHASDDRRRLTLDHVHDHATAAKRAKSDRFHLVAACGWANNEGWCSAHRNDERQYLREVEG
jgi:hypothetical protein